MSSIPIYSEVKPKSPLSLLFGFAAVMPSRLTEMAECMDTTSTTYSCSLPIDPGTVSTAQQKKISFRTRRVFTNKRVAAAMKVISLLAGQHTSRVHAAVPPGSPVRLSATFHYAYPKGTPRKNLVDGAPMPSGADLDNRFKAVGDALTLAGWWPDDRLITTLILRKRRTTGKPRMEFTVAADTPDATPSEDAP